MPANITDKITSATNGSRPVPTTLTSLHAGGGTTLSCASLSGWPTDTAVHFIIYTTNASGNKVAGTQTDWKGVVSGNSLVNCELKAGTDSGYNIGAIVECAPTAYWAKDLSDALQVEHNKDGTHGDITADSITTGSITVTGGGLSPVGSIMQYAGSSAPSGWLLADGSAVSRTTYSALYTAIGTSYGSGDGSTTFNLPNLKGKVPVGKDSSDTSFDALGETGGAKTHTLTTSEMPAHSHTDSGHGHGFSGGGGYGAGAFDGSRFRADANSPANSWSFNIGTGNANIQNTGGGGAHNNLQPYIVLNYIIKS